MAETLLVIAIVAVCALYWGRKLLPTSRLRPAIGPKAQGGGKGGCGTCGGCKGGGCH
ncbi:hypothetical protein [Brytella acorum]|uniref:FeoB-associated Cys-rich membrane protein n=1 Tax=Brytella acorum TaxID=2959299 RepID=A0AA35VAU3_9PROT|nr:hypothetical protein [Brytella acorum]MDF3623999.1 hypothetical protein [Brytella acorum]CAI9120898.1 hypothetical protein LMG32879_001738 [Brytella acorum]